MSILQLTKTLPDGRTVHFHAPTEFHLDVQTNLMRIVIESYTTEREARIRGASSAKSHIYIQLPDWSHVYANNLLNFVLSEPDWSSATVLS